MSSKLKVLIVEPSSIIVEGLIKILNGTELFHILPPLTDVQHLLTSSLKILQKYKSLIDKIL